MNEDPENAPEPWDPWPTPPTAPARDEGHGARPLAAAFRCVGMVTVGTRAGTERFSLGTCTLPVRFDGGTRADGSRTLAVTWPAVVRTAPMREVSEVVSLLQRGPGTGTYDPATGALTLALHLVLRNSLPGFYDLAVALAFTTGTVRSRVDGAPLVGSPVTAAGRVRVVATGHWDADGGGGLSLAGCPCAVVLDGVLAPRP